MTVQMTIRNHLEMAQATIRAGLYQQAVQELRCVLRLANNHNPELRSPIFRAMNVIRPMVQS